MASDYAMQAKARSMYAKHLTLEQYQKMTSFKDVPSIAAYLKNDARYKAVLSSIDENNIHRETLEKHIRLLGQTEFLKLMRFVKLGRTNFYQYYVKRREIEQILYVIHSIDSNVPYKMDAYIGKLNDLMELDIHLLSQMRSFDQLQTYLDTTSYKGVFHLPKHGEPVDISDLEASLSHHYREYVQTLIKKEPNYHEIQKLFDMDDELKMIEYVYRLKKNYHLQPDKIMGRIAYRPYFISISQMKQWVNQYDAEAFIEAFNHSAYKRYMSGRNFVSIETYLNVIRYRIYEHHFRFATNTNLTLMSYLELVRYEIKNVIDIVEGVRYGMSPDTILSFITI